MAHICLALLVAQMGTTAWQNVKQAGFYPKPAGLAFRA